LFPFATNPLARRTAAGFSLVEIMVGMVIGMLGLIIMMQVFSLSESQKRATTGGGDAQSSGAIALFGLQRDVRQAGFGTSDPKLVGCSVTLRTGVTVTSFAPVTINHAAITGQDANTDTLLVTYGGSNGSPQGDTITTQPASAGTAVSPDIYAMATPTSFTAGDQVIATPQIRATPCNLSVAGVASIGTGNAANVIVTAGSGVTNMTNGTLFNLGPQSNVKVLAYAIRGGNLTLCDYMANNCGDAANNNNAAIWVPIANNVVSLKALYGHDTNTPMDGIADEFNSTSPTTACGWVKVFGLRLALVARNATFEKTAVTTAAALAWDGDTASNAAAVAANDIDLSADANWQNYRYRVLQTVVPLRNLVWQGVQTGC
jgi:type IV pilus assembly protein PilW